jgi:hypothetical protein
MRGTNLQRVLAQSKLDFEKPQRPLCRFQEYIVALTESAALLRKLLVEVKELVLILGLIIFSAWAIVALLLRIHH